MATNLWKWFSWMVCCGTGQGGWRHIVVTWNAGTVCEGHLGLHGDENHLTLTAVSMQLCWPRSPPKWVPTAQVPTAAQDQLWRTLGENHLSSKRKNQSVSSGWHYREQLRLSCTYKPSPSHQGWLNSSFWVDSFSLSFKSTYQWLLGLCSCFCLVKRNRLLYTFITQK